MMRRALGRGIAAAFSVVAFTPGVRPLVSHPRFEGLFKFESEPLGGWPQSIMIWARFRLLGQALESNCYHKPPPSPVRLRTVARQQAGCQEQQQQQPSSSRTDRLRILSQNLWCSHFLGGPIRVARLQLLLDHLDSAHYDLCVFQELFTFGVGPVRLNAECHWLQQQLHARGFEYSSVASVAASAPYFGQDAGLVAFSRLPLESAEVERFSNCRALSQKGVLRLRLATAHGPVHVHTTHLEHSDQDRQIVQLQEVAAGCRARQENSPDAAVHEVEVARVDSSGDVAAVAATVHVAPRELVIGDMNICAARHRGPMYDLLQQAMAGVGLGRNLTAELGWTCDLSMAADPLEHSLHLLSQYPVLARQQRQEKSVDFDTKSSSSSPSSPPRWGATIDHCWLSPAWAEGARCSVLQMVGDSSSSSSSSSSSAGAAAPEHDQLLPPADNQLGRGEKREGMQSLFTASDHLGLVVDLPLTMTSARSGAKM